MNAGVLPLFLALLKVEDAALAAKALELFCFVVTLCEHSPNAALWPVLGVSRQRSHVIMDFVAATVPQDVVTEALVRRLLQLIVNSEHIDDNGGCARRE